MEKKHVFTEGLFTARNAGSLGAAVILEIAIALGIAGILIWEELHPSPPPPHIENSSITIPPQPPPPPPPPPKSAPPLPNAPQPQPLSEVPPIPSPVPTPNSVPPPPQSPPPVPVQQPVNTATIESEFITAMRTAIENQAIHNYPKEAVVAGETGVVLVSFDYVNGVVSNVHVDRSSGSRALDKGAIQAVQTAPLPVKPPELVDRKHFQLQVLYTLGN